LYLHEKIKRSVDNMILADLKWFSQGFIGREFDGFGGENLTYQA
jgi:hypothetical protein